MTVYAVELDPRPVHRSFRLTRPASGPSTSVRPALVLPERDGRALLAAAAAEDVGSGGCFSAGPAGVQLWSGPWRGAAGSHGEAEHLGSVDWSYDTPARHYITVYRVLVTAAGAQSGLTSEALLARVLGLVGMAPPADHAQVSSGPPRDPFRSAARRGSS